MIKWTACVAIIERVGNPKLPILVRAKREQFCLAGKQERMILPESDLSYLMLGQIEHTWHSILSVILFVFLAAEVLSQAVDLPVRVAHQSHACVC